MISMAGEDVSSEYGGQPGIIQPDAARVDADAAAASLVHDSTEAGATGRRGVYEAATVLRRAALKEARGVQIQTGVDPDTGLPIYSYYTEDQAREDYISGNNY